MTDSRQVLEQYNELLGILGRFTQHKMNMDEAIQVSCIIDKLPPSWKDFKHTLKHLKEELTLVELGSHLRIEESLRVQDSDKPKGNNVAGPSVVNMVEHNNSSRYNDNKGKHKHHDNTRVDPNKKAKPTCWKCGKTGHIKRDCKGVNVGNKANGSGTKGSVDGSSNSLKGQNMFNKSLQVYYVTYVSEAYFVQDDDVAWWVDSGATVMLNIINDNIAPAFMSTSKLNDSILWHARLGHLFQVLRPKLLVFLKGTEDHGGSVVPAEVDLGCLVDIGAGTGTPIEVEHLNKTKLEEVGLNCNHNTPLSSREVPSFDGLEPQPLLNSPSLDEMFDDDWGLESKEVSPQGEELSLFERPNEVERGRILEAHSLESIFPQ
ncbi:zinc finger, CCHC-type containing protein [Tanacetum coccineum]